MYVFKCITSKGVGTIMQIFSLLVRILTKYHYLYNFIMNVILSHPLLRKFQNYITHARIKGWGGSGSQPPFPWKLKFLKFTWQNNRLGPLLQQNWSHTIEAVYRFIKHDKWSVTKNSSFDCHLEYLTDRLWAGSEWWRSGNTRGWRGYD